MPVEQQPGGGFVGVRATTGGSTIPIWAIEATICRYFRLDLIDLLEGSHRQDHATGRVTQSSSKPCLTLAGRLSWPVS
jgi:hypothetical protein